MEIQCGSINNNKNKGSGVCLNTRGGEEFQEVEMWEVAKKDKQHRAKNFHNKHTKSFSSVSNSLSAAAAPTSYRLALPSASKMVIQRAKSWGNEGKKISLQQSSAPMRVPDLYSRKNQENGEETGEFVKDEEDEDEEMIPPHEYIARRMTMSRVASYSMCEGIGRTLKGRDLCKLRNSILTQTGFLEN